MENDDLAILLKDAPVEEVDMIHRLMHEWGVGPEGSFPVQLALLTRAQWRMAAAVPRSLHDSRKWLEQHLAEYRRQTAAQVEDFADALETKTQELKQELESIIETHSKAVQEAAALMNKEALAARSAVREIRNQTESCLSEWKRIMNQFATERHDLQATCQTLKDEMAWWTVKTLLIAATIGATGGALVGHFLWKQ